MACACTYRLEVRCISLVYTWIRALDLALDALESDPANRGLLRLVGGFNQKTVPHLLGFKLAHYRTTSVAKYHRAALRSALKNKVIGVLVRSDLARYVRSHGTSGQLGSMGEVQSAGPRPPLVRVFLCVSQSVSLSISLSVSLSQGVWRYCHRRTIWLCVVVLLLSLRLNSPGRQNYFRCYIVLLLLVITSISQR